MGLLVTIIMGFSIFITFLSLFYAVLKISWKAMLTSFIASLPVSLYLAGVNPPLSFVGLLPVFLLILTILFKIKFREHSVQ